MKAYCSVLFLSVAVFCIRSFTQGCHNYPSQFNAQAGRNEIIEEAQTRTLREYFSGCMEKEIGDVVQLMWNTTVDFTVLDSNWYFNTDTANCSAESGRDSAACWKGILNNYLHNSSPLLPVARDCIDEYSERRRAVTTSARRIVKRQVRFNSTMEENRNYSSCLSQVITLTGNRRPLDIPTVIELAENHLVYNNREGGDCILRLNSTLSRSPSTELLLESWPYILQGIVRSDSAIAPAVDSCNRRVFPPQKVIVRITPETHGQGGICETIASTGIRIACGNNAVEESEDDCPTTSCCWECSTRPFCFARFELTQAAEVQSLTRSLPRVDRPTSTAPLRNLMRSFSTLGIEGRTQTRIEGRISGISLTSLLTFPQCAVETPFCYRTACNTDTPNAETNPLECLSDPSCCFDQDLFIYRALFGIAYMGGAPVCYYGPTSSRYRELATLITPYNPFFQSIIIDVFQEFLDTGANFQERVTCLVANTLGGSSIIPVTECGWPGITELQCQLKGCCHSSSSGCNYPAELGPGFPIGPIAPINEFYPELIAQTPEEASCNNPTTFSPSIYRRLPCRTVDATTTNVQAYAFCPNAACCRNPLALVPGLAAFITATSSNTQTGPGLTIPPAFFGLVTGGGFQISDIAQFYCPYLYIQFPGFPDLTANSIGCCSQQICYHRKQPPPASWSQWTGFGRCSAPCGGQGTRSRSRSCLTPSGSAATTCSGSSTSFENCVGTSCCQWTSWGSFGNCNARCGGGFGFESRSRVCFGRNNSPCGSCVGDATEQRRCQRQNCGSWGSWGSWSSCNAQCGSSGERSRTRPCRDQFGRPAGGCPGTGTQRLTCQGPSCCSWTAYGSYSACNAPCNGNGVQTRRRRCQRNGSGIQCNSNSCPGSSTDSRSCRGTSCCSWSLWGAYSDCDAPCGQSGFRTRTRSCQPNTFSCSQPNACPGSLTDSQQCFGSSCFRLEEWTTWGACPSTCNRQRRRYCIDGNNQRVESSSCDQTSNTVQRNSCTGDACPPVITDPWIMWGTWFPWTQCSATCGPGTRSRERNCLYRGRQDQYLDPVTCTCTYPQSEGPRQEEPCTDFPCFTGPVFTYAWGIWGSWTGCSSTCGAATRSRSRICFSRPGNNQASSSLECPGSDTETENCYTNWSSWTNCNCRNNIRTRVRCPCTQDNSCPNPEFAREPCSCSG